MRWLVWLASVVIAVALWNSPSDVRAGGLEIAGAGAQGFARGGAVTAKADDPMVLSYNPAGLVELRGSQILISVNTTLMSACVDPLGYYGWGAYGGGGPSRIPVPGTKTTVPLGLGTATPETEAYYNSALDTVCMKQNVVPIPQLGFTTRIGERFGIGFGIIFPNAAPQGQWGDENGVIQTPNGPRPAATRYMLIRSGTLGLFPTLGLAYKLADWLRIGAAFEWGIINIDNTSMASLSAGTSPNSDIIARVTGTDWFVPALTASLHLVPTDSIDIVAAFRYQDAVDASGTIELKSGIFDPNNKPYSTLNDVTSVKQSMPWQLRGGIRYGSRLAPRPTGNGHDDLKNGGRIHDAMEDERWDVELDLVYEMNGRNKEQRVAFKENQAVNFQSAANDSINMVTFPNVPRLGDSPDTVIQKRWKDQIAVRLGGSFNVMPGRFAISWGANYETRGVDPAYMQIDYWPVSRIGLHAGVKIRVARTIDLFASYGHIFQESIVVAAPDAGVAQDISTTYRTGGEITAIDKRVGVLDRRIPQMERIEQAPASPDAQARLVQNVTKVVDGSPPYIINSGTYRSSIDVVAFGANVHF